MSRKKKSHKKNKIYIGNWTQHRPYKGHNSVDLYYLGVANRVLHAIESDPDYDYLVNILGREWNITMAIFLTSYLEDVVSETHIWNTFTDKHQELYGTPFRFYSSGANHNPEEVSLGAIKFLLWYYTNAIQKNTLIFPEMEFISNVGSTVYDILDEEWEVAPENSKLKSCYHLDPNESDFFKVRDVMKTLLLNTYLFQIDTVPRLIESSQELSQEERHKSHFEVLFHGHVDDCIHSFRTKLLNMSSKEWLAALLGKHHNLTSHISDLSQKVTGYFFIKGEDEDHILLEHLASAKKFKLIKKSTKVTFTKANDRICHISLIKWKGVWWNSGPLIELDFNANLVLDEKRSPDSLAAVSFLDHETQQVENDLKLQLDAFLEYNDGSQFAFISSNKIDDFCNSFMAYYSESQKSCASDKEAALKRAREAGYINPKNNLTLISSSIRESGLVYFNTKSGIEIVFGLNAAFPLDNNPYFPQDDIRAIEGSANNLIMTDSCSAELVRHWIKLCKDKIDYFETTHGKYINENLDFLLRFWKLNEYHSIPKMAYVGHENTGFV